MYLKEKIHTLDKLCSGVSYSSIGAEYIFFITFIYLFIIWFWLRWVFVVVHGLSLVAVSEGYSSLRCMGFSLQWPLCFAEHGV